MKNLWIVLAGVVVAMGGMLWFEHQDAQASEDRQVEVAPTTTTAADGFVDALDRYVDAQWDRLECDERLNDDLINARGSGPNGSMTDAELAQRQAECDALAP